MRYLGRFWNANDIEIYEIEGRIIALYGWNTETYTDCFELAKNKIDVIADNIEVKPIYNSDFEIIDFEIIGG